MMYSYENTRYEVDVGVRCWTTINSLKTFVAIFDANPDNILALEIAKARRINYNALNFTIKDGFLYW